MLFGYFKNPWLPQFDNIDSFCASSASFWSQLKAISQFGVTFGAVKAWPTLPHVYSHEIPVHTCLSADNERSCKGGLDLQVLIRQLFTAKSQSQASTLLQSLIRSLRPAFQIKIKMTSRQTKMVVSILSVYYRHAPAKTWTRYITKTFLPFLRKSEGLGNVISYFWADEVSKSPKQLSTPSFILFTYAIWRLEAIH